jgi:hypothetical protein
MPAIAMSPLTEPVVPVSCFYAGRWADAPHAQGAEGRKVSEKAEEVYRHWSERAEVLLMPREEADEFSTQVPPNRVFYVKTRYVYVGKGLPRPFDLDDG